MQDTELYEGLLGFKAPWSVERVAVDYKQLQVDVFAKHAEGISWPCPECGKALALYDHSEARVWRHLDSMQFKTFLHARVPRVDCPEHGVKQAKVPWSEPRSRFTTLFERFAIQVLLEMSIVGASRTLRISWDEAQHLMRRAVARGLRAKKAKRLRYLGIDEKAAKRRHVYFTIFSDLTTGTVEHISDERTADSVKGFFATLSEEKRGELEAVALDMWRPYIFALQKELPNAAAQMVFDKFHIMRLVNEAVNMVRKREHRALRAEGDESLMRTKFIWLSAKENLNEEQLERFKELKSQNLKTGRAWALKESLRHFWRLSSATWARKFWARWYGWAVRSQLEPMKKVARTIAAHLTNVLTYFNHRITNATSEGLNSKIQTVLKRAYGYRNLENFKTAIYFHCGGLPLLPTHGEP